MPLPQEGRRYRAIAATVVTFFLFLLGHNPGALLGSTFVSQSGHTYVTADTAWAVTVGTDSVRVDSLCAVVQVLEDSVLTDQKLDDGGFPNSTVVIDSLPDFHYAISIPDSVDFEAYLDSLESWSFVRWAAYDPLVDYYGRPGDTYFDEHQWGFEDTLTFMHSAWDIVRADGDVLIAVADTGFDDDHDDLEHYAGGEILAGTDWTTCGRHGTAVAGIIGASTNNNMGVAGVAGIWNGIGSPNILRYKISSDGDGAGFDGTGFSALAQAIGLAAQDNAKVLNLSLGTHLANPQYPFIETALENAIDNDDVVVVVAAGQGRNAESFMAWPASHAQTIAVGAMTKSKSRYGWFRSETGPGADLDVLAPGGAAIVTTDLIAENWECGGPCPHGAECYIGFDPDDEYTFDSAFGGTSAAAPFVAGVAALVREANSDLDWSEVRDIIRHSATKLDTLDGYFSRALGYGLVNALGAVVGAKYDAQLIGGVIDTSVTLPDYRKPFRNLYLRSDVKIDSGAVVTIRDSTTVYMASGDSVNIAGFGSDEDRIEIIISDGRLISKGSSGAGIEFVSVDEDEGDWYGIIAGELTGGTGSLEMEYSTVRDAVYGIVAVTTESLEVSNSTFLENENLDFKLGGSPKLAVITDNTITVGGGTGIELTNTDSLFVFDGNTITGDPTASTAGIRISGSSPQLEGNTIEDFDIGTGVKIESGEAVLSENTIEDSKWGIYVTGGSPEIGTADTLSDNTIRNNTRGIYSACVGPGCPACSGFAPKVRNNAIYYNWDGVYVQKRGFIDLGTSGDDGLNSIESNTDHCIYNVSDCDTIQAVGNYWGVCDGSTSPVDTCTAGLVNAGNAKCAEPARVFADVEAVPGGRPQLHLLGIWPNPVKGTGTIRFAVSRQSMSVHVQVFDLAGRLVRDFGDNPYPPGRHELHWLGVTDSGVSVSNGLYFIRISADGSLKETAKIMVIR